MRERILVTTSDNIEFFEDGTYELHDGNKVGHLVQLHTITATQLNPETNQLQTGIMIKAEVYWEHNRILSTENILIPVDNLVWIKFDDDEDEGEDIESDDDI